jgi:glycosyltransferase involved in cell wall biosynthesis
MPRLTVSFCIPTHGRPRLLLEALKSGLAQTRLPDEIVVSDDLGSEETRALVSAFARLASVPVRYVHCATSQSQADNMNHCLREAACDLILLLHDDDLLMARAVEALARPLEENEAVVGTYGKQMFITDGGKELPGESDILNRDYRRNATYAGLQPDAILSGIWQQFPNDGFMVKASVAREVRYKPEYGAGTDFDFGIRMGERGMFYFVDEYTAKYRNSAHSIGRGTGQKSDDCAYHAMHILLRLLETYPRYKVEIVTILKNFSSGSIRMAANTGRLKEAVAWYFGSYHRHRILTPGGIRSGLLMTRTWLRQKFARTPPVTQA